MNFSVINDRIFDEVILETLTVNEANITSGSISTNNISANGTLSVNGVSTLNGATITGTSSSTQVISTSTITSTSATDTSSSLVSLGGLSVAKDSYVGLTLNVGGKGTFNAGTTTTGTSSSTKVISTSTADSTSKTDTTASLVSQGGLSVAGNIYTQRLYLPLTTFNLSVTVGGGTSANLSGTGSGTGQYIILGTTVIGTVTITGLTITNSSTKTFFSFNPPYCCYKPSISRNIVHDHK